MTTVVDASVAVKWVLPEPGSERADAIRTADDDLIAPSPAYAEIGSAQWRPVLRGDVTAFITADSKLVTAAENHKGHRTAPTVKRPSTKP